LRIDRYLHCIRLVKSRTLAQSVIETGHVRIDGRRVEKTSEDVRIGSTIALPVRRGPPAEARACYQELGIDEPRARS
jgi:ribosome-associated heat shock protein Hsp15